MQDSDNHTNSIPPESLPPREAGGQDLLADQDSGGLTSNSPPSKVKPLSELLPIPLSCGIDTLVLSIDVEWSSPDFLSYLSHLKQKAIQEDAAVAGVLVDWPFLLHQYGRRGYEWLLEGAEYSYRIGNWLSPKSRPSVIVEIRSETLWHHGPRAAVDRCLKLLQTEAGGKLTMPAIVRVRVSRADLCCDLLLHEDQWTAELGEDIVSRAVQNKFFRENGRFTGLVIGSGCIMARIYDKGHEIATKSKKYWMFDIWGITEVPDGYRAVRVEFQLQREALKELGLDTPDDLFRLETNAWAYCTQHWLKFQDRPGLHHTQRHVLPWWTIAQSSYRGAQSAHPLIRSKLYGVKIKQLYQQANGLLSSIAALHQEQCSLPADSPADLDSVYQAVFEASGMIDDQRDFSEQVRLKRSRYHRAIEQTEHIHHLRNELGFASQNQTQIGGENGNK